ncbi:MAG: 30S ribosomal protein S6 [Patescibacteria group bacterium]|nr:30S ribosomal protein S6 [Patescibacteria group bacterium]
MIYELLYIVPSQFSDTEIDGVTKKVSDLLEKAEAKIEKTENLGKIKLAYPVKKVRHGTYILNYISVEDGSVLAKLDTDLKHTDEILRHIFVKREAGVPVEHVEITSYQAPLTPEGKRANKTPEKMVQKQEPVQEEVKEKMSVSELDKKLDEILDSDITQNI